jgi:hypothetical protein
MEDCCSKVVPENGTRTFKRPAAIVERALKDNFIQRGNTVFEPGSGCLRNSSYLLDKGYEITVKELEPVVSKYHAKYERFKEKGGKVIFEWPSPSSSDVAICTFTIESLCNKEERLQFLSKLVASLKRKGKLVLAVRGPRDVKTVAASGKKCGDGYITPNRTFIKPFTVREIISLLKGRGLKILRIYGGSKSNGPQIIEVIAERQ